MKPFRPLNSLVAVFLATGARARSCKPSAVLHNSIRSGSTTIENFPSTTRPYVIYPDNVKTRFGGVEEEPRATRGFASEATDSEYGLDNGAISALVSTIPLNSDLTKTGILDQSTITISEYGFSTTKSEIITPDRSKAIPSGASVTEAGPAMSEPVAAMCRKELGHVCGDAGLFNDSESNLIKIFQQHDLLQCKEECERTENCLAIGFTTGGQCELYDTNVYSMGFETKDGWYFSVHDICCFEVEA